MVQPLDATMASKPKFYYIVYKKIFRKFQILQKKKLKNSGLKLLKDQKISKKNYQHLSLSLSWTC